MEKAVNSKIMQISQHSPSTIQLANALQSNYNDHMLKSSVLRRQAQMQQCESLINLNYKTDIGRQLSNRLYQYHGQIHSLREQLGGLKELISRQSVQLRQQIGSIKIQASTCSNQFATYLNRQLTQLQVFVLTRYQPVSLAQQQSQLQQLSRYEEQIRDLNSQLAQKQDVIEVNKANLRQSQELQLLQNSNIKQMQEENQKLREQCNRNASTVKCYQEKIAEMQQLAQKQEELMNQQLAEISDPLKQQYNMTLQENQQLTQQVRSLKDQLKQQQNEQTQALLQSQTQFRSQLLVQRNENEQAELEAEQLQQEVKALTARMLEQDIQHSKTLSDISLKNKQRTALLEEESRKQLVQLAELRKELASLESERKNYASYEQACKDDSNEREQLTLQLNAAAEENHTLKQKCQALEGQILQAANQNTQLRDQVGQLQKEKARLFADQQLLQSQQRQIDEYKSQLQRQLTLSAQYEDKLADYSSIEQKLALKYKERLLSCKNDVQRISLAMQQLRHQSDAVIAAYEGRVSSLSTQLAGLAPQLRDENAANRQLQQQVEQLKARLLQLHGDMLGQLTHKLNRQAQLQRAAQEEYNAQLQRKQQQNEQVVNLLATLKEEAGKLSAKLEEKVSQLKAKEVEISALQQSTQSAETQEEMCRGRIAGLERQIDGYVQQLDALQKEIERREVESANQSIQQQEKVQMIETISRAKELLEGEVGRLGQEKDDLRKQSEQLQKRAEIGEAKAAAASQTVKQLTEQLRAMKDEREAMKKQLLQQSSSHGEAVSKIRDFYRQKSLKQPPSEQLSDCIVFMLEQCGQQLAEISEQDREEKSLNQQIQSLKAAAQKDGAALEQSAQQINQLNAKLAESTQQMARLTQQNETMVVSQGQYVKSIQQLTETLEGEKAKYQQLSNNTRQMKSVSAKDEKIIELLKKQISELEQQVQDKNAQLLARKSYIEELQREVNKILSGQKSSEVAMNDLRRLTFIQNPSMIGMGNKKQ